ncbi:MAG: hypothetical protein RL518_1098 [Pseudomonadota bacterium]|jgi:hypothetical protein
MRRVDVPSPNRPVTESLCTPTLTGRGYGEYQAGRQTSISAQERGLDSVNLQAAFYPIDSSLGEHLSSHSGYVIKLGVLGRTMSEFYERAFEQTEAGTTADS